MKQEEITFTDVQQFINYLSPLPENGKEITKVFLDHNSRIYFFSKVNFTRRNTPYEFDKDISCFNYTITHDKDKELFYFKTTNAFRGSGEYIIKVLKFTPHLLEMLGTGWNNDKPGITTVVVLYDKENPETIIEVLRH